MFSEEEKFIPGCIITIHGIRKPEVYFIINKWKINSTEYTYKLLSIKGKIYEAYYEYQFWSFIA